MSLSIRTKIALALSIVTAITLAIYIGVAKNVFETDKVAYVYDSSLETTKSKAGDVSNQLRSAVSLARGLIFNVDPATHSLNAAGKFLFTNANEILAFRVLDTSSAAVSVVQEKQSGYFQKPLLVEKLKELSGRDHATLIALSLEDSIYAIGIPFSESNSTVKKQLQVVLSFPSWKNQFRSNNSSISVLVNSEGAIISDILSADVSAAIQKWSASAKQSGASEKTFVDVIGSEEYLAASVHVDTFGLTFYNLSLKKKAFHALNNLYLKSIIFFAMTTAIILIISLLISKSITSNLEILTDATAEISKGNFDITVPNAGDDEVGKLSQAFLLMSQRIKKLIIETVEKSRMETELKTARTVQETLLPKAGYSDGKFLIDGYYESASECGGDWWFYQTLGDKFYFIIADATGHGASAALITSAARSCFSVAMQLKDLDIKTLCQYLNRAIFESSNGHVLMTAFVGCYDMKNRNMDYVNASHEAGVVLQKNGEFELITDPVSHRLGQSLDNEYQVGSRQLQPGERIFFLTDGLLAIENESGKVIREKTVYDKMVSMFEKPEPVADLKKEFLTFVNGYRGQAPLKDDVTFVVVEVPQA